MITSEQFEEKEENIFRKEYLLETSSNTGSYTGEYVDRNGVYAMRIGPSPFWFGDTDLSKSHLGSHFKANTQYKFDIWIDTDDIYYSGNSSNVPGGIGCYYTDNTVEWAIATGNINTPKGWQHIILYSNPNKSIKGISVYYYIGTPAYYRYDSMIIPMTTDTLISKKGIETGQIRETIEEAIEKGGIVSAKEFIEN